MRQRNHMGNRNLIGPNIVKIRRTKRLGQGELVKLIQAAARFKDKIDTNVPEDILAQIGYTKKDLEGDWVSVFDSAEDAMDGDDNTWNRFQMGWHVGVGFQYKPIYLGVQYGTDFIPAYSHKYTYDGESETYKINTGNLKVTLGYVF